MKPGDLTRVVRENSKSNRVVAINVQRCPVSGHIPVGELVVFLGKDKGPGWSVPNQTWAQVLWGGTTWYVWVSDVEEVQ